MRVEEIRRLIKLVEESQVDELDVRRWWTRVRILKKSGDHQVENGQTFAIPTPPPLPIVHTSARSADPKPISEKVPAAADASNEAEPTDVDEGLVPVKSPMVGTFYRAPSPESPPYVELNQRIEVGQVVCIVEAMKLMNEIESEVAGTVARILVQNGQPVEFNQILFLVKTN